MINILIISAIAFCLHPYIFRGIDAWLAWESTRRLKKAIAINAHGKSREEVEERMKKLFETLDKELGDEE